MNMIISCRTTICLAMLALASLAEAATIYVDHAATGNNTGTNWTDAYTTITQALSGATSGDDLWIAQGSYYPGANRADYFQMKDGVALYGGFTSGAAWSDRDYTNNIVILSGDIQQDGVITNNAYHVARAVIISNVVLDGLTITAGYADRPDPDDRGAGIFISNALVTVRNATICDNVATQYGGGIFNCCFSPLAAENSTFRSNSSYSGGGLSALNISSVSTCRIERCVFADNNAHGPYALSAGGGAVYSSFISLVVSNCTFSNNLAYALGGAMYARYSPNIVDSCTFIANATTNTSGGDIYGGAILVEANASLNVRNSTFALNRSGSYGGAIAHWTAYTTIIENCLFASNTCVRGVGYGSALAMYGAGPVTISNCRFAAHSGLGAAVYNALSSCLTLVDSIFCDNYGYEEAALHIAAGKTGIVVNTVFCGNRPRYYGAINNRGNLSLRNCLVAGNYGDETLYAATAGLKNQGTTVVANCTFANNKTASRGGAIHSGHIGAGNVCFITNSVFWGNRGVVTGDEIYATNCTLTIAYTDIKGGVSNGVAAFNSTVNDAGSNLNSNPLFPDPATGTWTAAGTYYPDLVRTVLTNANANWQSGELAGKLLNPNTNYITRQFYIYTNGVKSITVWGNATTGGLNSAYAIYDYHEQSQQGRWTLSGWVNDQVTSPCIDAGDPAFDYAREARPNGKRINLGAYGNTEQASLTHLPSGMIVLIQ